jgi:tetratricopeptide (TPR) repeat protein
MRARPEGDGVIDAPADDARSLFEAGEFEQSREAALRGLHDHPEDANLLRLVGKASAELGRDDAIRYLQRAVEVEPENADAWRDLGDALLFENRLAEATKAFRQTVELRPNDVSALVQLAHAAYAGGDPEEAIGHIRHAVERDPNSLAARRALLEIYRAARRFDDALAAAEELAESDPNDVLAALDVAELYLSLDHPVDASSAFARLRKIDEDPEHEIYAYHGMIEAEIHRGRWRRALDLTIEATRIDRMGRTTDVLAYVVAQVFGGTDRPAPARAEVDEALAASRAEHRRLHEESLVF